MGRGAGDHFGTIFGILDLCIYSFIFIYLFIFIDIFIDMFIDIFDTELGFLHLRYQAIAAESVILVIEGTKGTAAFTNLCVVGSIK